MNLLNAGSSSLKAVLMDSANGTVLARGWVGSTSQYQFAGAETMCKEILQLIRIN